jgi:hypothetical protein
MRVGALGGGIVRLLRFACFGGSRLAERARLIHRLKYGAS